MSLQLMLPAVTFAQAYGEGTYGSGIYGGDSTPADTDPPTTPGTPSTTSPTTDTTPVWSWTASTDTGSGLASPPYTVEWSQASDFGSGVTSSTAATNSFTHSSALAEGSWYFRVKATDASDNESSYSSNGSVLIDLTAPTDPGTPTTTTPTNSTTQNWSWTASSDTSGSGILQYAWRVVTNLGAAVTSGTTATASAITNLAEGAYTFFVKAIDNVLNESDETSSTLTVDTTAPVISLTALSPDPTTDTTPSFSGTATDALTALTAIEYQLDGGSWTTCTATDGSIDETSETFSCTLSELTDGSYTISVRATDSTSNTTSSENAGVDSFEVDTTDSTPTPTPTPTHTPNNEEEEDDDDDNNSSSSSSSRRSSECRSPKPDSTPDLFQINATTNSAKLYFTPSSGNRDKYFVMYGLMPGAEQYGFEFANTSNGVISVDINDLAPGTAYYFKVQARNGCTAGDWSNELAVRTGQRFPSYRWGSAGQIITTAVTNRVNPSAITTTTTNFSNTQLNQVKEPELPATTNPTPVPIATPRTTVPQPAAPTPVATPAPQPQNNPGFFEKVSNFFKNIF